MAKLKLEYITSYSANQYKFLPMPYMLIEHMAYKQLGSGPKILYTLMLNRLALSESNKERFTDEKGRLYIIYTVDQVMKAMNCSKPTAVKYIGELVEFGLIERVRSGQGKAARTYVKDFASAQCISMQDDCIEDESQRLKNFTSRSKEILPLEVKEFNPSNTDNSNTDNSLSSRQGIDDDRCAYGIRSNVYLSEREYKLLKDDYDTNLDKIINIISDRIDGSHRRISNYYNYIKKVAETEGFKSKKILEIEKKEHEQRLIKAVKREVKLGFTPGEDVRYLFTEAEFEKLKDQAHMNYLKNNGIDPNKFDNDKKMSSLEDVMNSLFNK